MCGRYYVDDETAREIERIIRIADEKVRKAASTGITLQAKDIHPTDVAPILVAEKDGISCRMQRWGFPGFEGKKVIFNVRSESALEKKMFKDSVEHRRVVVPATLFYEWNRNKEKNIFTREDQSIIFMAGIYSRFQDEDRFVILTTQANASMQPVHDRMPLILEESEIESWIFREEKTRDILQKAPCLLERRVEYEQMSLF